MKNILCFIALGALVFSAPSNARAEDTSNKIKLTCNSGAVIKAAGYALAADLRAKLQTGLVGAIDKNSVSVKVKIKKNSNIPSAYVDYPAYQGNITTGASLNEAGDNANAIAMSISDGSVGPLPGTACSSSFKLQALARFKKSELIDGKVKRTTYGGRSNIATVTANGVYGD